MTQLKYGSTTITVCDDYEDLGQRSAVTVAGRMRSLLEVQEEVRIVFAAAESQLSFYAFLALEPEIDWQRVTCFNMDDFWEPGIPEKYTCGYQTKKFLYDIVLPRAFHLLDCRATDPEVEAARFASLLRERPLDILCQGIGSSGHLALNEPGATDFNDSAWVRVVAVAEQSKRQLRADPGFCQLGSIPDRGLTMTIPALLSARFIYTMVPLALKKAIMTRLLGESTPTKQLPASILSTVEGILFVDQESCPDVLKT